MRHTCAIAHRSVCCRTAITASDTGIITVRPDLHSAVSVVNRHDPRKTDLFTVVHTTLQPRTPTTARRTTMAKYPHRFPRHSRLLPPCPSSPASSFATHQRALQQAQASISPDGMMTVYVERHAAAASPVQSKEDLQDQPACEPWREGGTAATAWPQRDCDWLPHARCISTKPSCDTVNVSAGVAYVGAGAAHTFDEHDEEVDYEPNIPLLPIAHTTARRME